MDVLTSAILTGLDTREQTLARTVKQSKSTDILSQIQENPSNKMCADCSAIDPVWGVINLGIMVCINCSGEEGERGRREGARGRERGREGEREREREREGKRESSMCGYGMECLSSSKQF